MAVTDKESSGGRTKKRRRKYSRYSKPPMDPYYGIEPGVNSFIGPYNQQSNNGPYANGQNHYSSSVGEWLQKYLQGATSAVQDSFTPGGADMQNIAPQVTMQPRPPVATEKEDPYSGVQQYLDLAASMLGEQGGGSYDYESAMQQAAQGIRQAYGAEINAIRQNNRVARKSSKRARKEIDHLYKGLSKMYGKQEVSATRQGQKNANQQMNIAERGNTILQDLNNTMINDEAKLLQDLGQQQAFDQVISPDYDRMGQQVAANTKTGTNAASRATKMGQNNARWFDRAQGGAQLEGTNRQADMIGMLQAFLMDNRSQIAGLKGQRAQEIAASNNSIMSQAASAEADAQQQQWDNVMELIGSVADIEDTNSDNARADAEFRWDKKMDRREYRLDQQKAQGTSGAMSNYSPGVKNALSIIAQQADPNDQKATNALLQLFGSDAWRNDEVVVGGGDTVKLTPYEAMARARQVGTKLGLQGKELNDFIMAAAASVG